MEPEYVRKKINPAIRYSLIIVVIVIILTILLTFKYEKEIEINTDELEISYMNKFVEKKLDVLVEEYKDGYSYGHTSNFIYVKIKGEYKHNEFVNVKLVKVEYPNMIGEV